MGNLCVSEFFDAKKLLYKYFPISTLYEETICKIFVIHKMMAEN